MVDPDVIRHAPGLGGVLVAVVLKFKDGWRVMITQGVAGVAIVLALRGFTEWLSHKMDVPPDLVGFLIGGLGVGFLTKLAETVQQLEFAKPVNAFIERWTGAKAPQEPTP